jgi:hypothetical protein
MKKKRTQRTKLYQRVTLANARHDFAEQGLLLLAKTYTSISTLMPFRCKECGYESKLCLNDVRGKGCGCRMCGIRRRVAARTFSVETVRKLLVSAKIKLLSETYTNSTVPLRVKCMKCGHIWQTPFNNLNPKKSKHNGCPPCGLKRRVAKRRFTTKQVRDELVKGGIVLLGKYEGSQRFIAIKHKKCGHTELHTTWNAIRSGRGCGRCAKNARATADDYLSLAKMFKGRLIKKAATAQADSVWECSLGHRFSRCYSSIKSLQTFCTTCNSAYAEMLCKAMVEKLFAAPFVRVRVKDMRSPKGTPLELDLFNSDLLIAIEHNGAHHYGPQHNWGGEQAFRIQRANDNCRRRYCRKNRILLVEIRQLGSITSAEEAKAQIRKALIRAKRRLPLSFDSTDVRDLTPKVATEAYWESVQAAAKTMGLKIEPCVYLTADSPVPVKCEKGHLTQKTPRSILQRHKCDTCYILRLRKPVRLSDGRVFKSGTDAAKALGVRKESVNRAARDGSRVRGLYVHRTK